MARRHGQRQPKKTKPIKPLAMPMPHPDDMMMPEGKMKKPKGAKMVRPLLGILK